MKLLKALNRPLPGWATIALIALIGGGAYAATPLFYGNIHVATSGAYVAANPSGSSHCGVLPTAFDIASAVNGGNHYMVGDTSGNVGICGNLSVAGSTSFGNLTALQPVCTDVSAMLTHPCSIPYTAAMPAGHLVCSATNALPNYGATIDQCQNTAPNSFSGNLTQSSGVLTAFHLESNDVAVNLPVCSNGSAFLTTSGCTQLTGTIATPGPLCSVTPPTVVACNGNFPTYNYPAHGVAILIDATDGCGSVTPGLTCNTSNSSCASGAACGTVETTHGAADCTGPVLGNYPTGALFNTPAVTGWAVIPYYNNSTNHFGLQFFNFTGSSFNFGAASHAVAAGFTCLI